MFHRKRAILKRRTPTPRHSHGSSDDSLHHLHSLSSGWIPSNNMLKSKARMSTPTSTQQMSPLGLSGLAYNWTGSQAVAFS